MKLGCMPENFLEDSVTGSSLNDGELKTELNEMLDDG